LGFHYVTYNKHQTLDGGGKIKNSFFFVCRQWQKLKGSNFSNTIMSFLIACIMHSIIEKSTRF